MGSEQVPLKELLPLVLIKNRIYLSNLTMPIIERTAPGSPYKWIDVLQPSEEELKQISRQYKLHRYTVMDCLQPDHLPKQETVGEMQFFITRYLIPLQSPADHIIQEISNKLAIFYNSNLIITVHRNKEVFLKEIQSRQLKEPGIQTSGELVTRLLWQILHSYDKPALDLSATIDQYEEQVFLGPLSKELLQDLYLIRRRTASCLKLLYLTNELINKIASTSHETTILQDVKDLYVKLVTLYEQAHEDTTHLLDIYLSLSSRNSNEVMKVLTIFSVFLLPPTFIVGLYGMNFEFMPEYAYPWGYPIVLIAIVLITLIIYFWFKRKKWL